MNNTGIVFDVQRFSVNDGEGIRTTIFLKGCSLRCKWCHNPESISPKIQLNYNPKKCVLCGKCVKHVNGDGIEIVDGKLKIDFCKHEQNFQLIDVCPYKAYSKYGKEYTVDELVDIVLKDKDYYDNSNGGVTFSGGEAINQIDFVRQLGLKLKNLGIHICLDVSGYDPANNIEKTLDFVDEYLLDYKLTNKFDYKTYIGKEFNVYKVLDLLKNNNKSVILRCPIIPSVNDTEEHFKAICDISNKYSNIIRYVDILPYHNMVKAYKFRYINDYRKFRVPSEKDKNKWKEILRQNGINKGVMENEDI